jgi:hypothetical protein
MSQNRKRANQQNSKRSSGPNSESGKAITRGNALRHGLLAQKITIYDECPEEFEALCKSAHDSLKPRDSLQEHLVDRIAVCLWRLRRIPNLEAGIVEYQSLNNELNGVDLQIREHNFEFHIPSNAEAKKALPASLKKRRTKILNGLQNGQAAVGGAFFRNGEPNDALGKLSRYESQISRELFRTLRELERLQTKAGSLELNVEDSSK